MTNGEDYVSWDRWQATNDGIVWRLDALERHAGEAAQARDTAERGRRDRAWVIVIGLVTGIVCPLVVTTVITWLHLQALR